MLNVNFVKLFQVIFLLNLCNEFFSKLNMKSLLKFWIKIRTENVGLTFATNPVFLMLAAHLI